MPVAFPSHAGLVSPLLRWFPERWSPTALWIGAMVPDVVDGLADLSRGHLGQWMGHSILGTFAFDVPAGLLLTLLVRTIAARMATSPRERLARGGRALLGIEPTTAARPLRLAEAVWLGAVSHVVTDLISHAGSMLLWPFRADPAWFGAGWQHAWFRVSPPGYPDYPVGVPFVLWLVLSLLGGVGFFVWWPKPRRDLTRAA
ncbi:MAG: DUF4184 family protein [Polyangiaceae bacterium]